MEVDGLEKHWEKATVNALLSNEEVTVETTNVSALTLVMGPGECLSVEPGKQKVTIDGAKIDAAPVLSDRSWTAHFRKEDGKWQRVDSSRRRHVGQAARLAGSDRRRLHGQLPHGPADRQAA